MPDYMVFRAQVPPSFDHDAYRERSRDPIRYDVVTVVQAESPQEAIQTLVNAIGVINAGMAAVECFHLGYESKGRVGEGGKLVAPSQLKELEKENGKSQ